MDKIIAVYKPKGPTSNDVVQIIKKLTGVKKVGHAGTLDPLAKGVLVVGIGREATKKLSGFVKKEKEYIANVKLGQFSTTDDEEGKKTVVKISKKPTLQEIKKVILKFQGKISQTPPLFSAVKIKGHEAYKLARQGKEPKLKPRQVEIKKIKILKYSWPILKLKVITGPGVYIRSLARDLGKVLGVGGYLADLERTRVGQFTKKDSIPLAKFLASKK